MRGGKNEKLGCGNISVGPYLDYGPWVVNGSYQDKRKKTSFWKQTHTKKDICTNQDFYWLPIQRLYCCGVFEPALW